MSHVRKQLSSFNLETCLDLHCASCDRLSVPSGPNNLAANLDLFCTSIFNDSLVFRIRHSEFHIDRQFTKNSASRCFRLIDVI